MARNFNGSSDKLLNTATPVVTAVPATMAAWVRTDITNAEKSITGVSDNASTNPLFRIGMSSTGKFLIQFRGTEGVVQQVVGTTTLSTTAYNHIVGTFRDNAGTLNLEGFLNGTSEGTLATGSPAITGLDQTEIGVLQRNSAAQFWDGDIGEAAIWSAVLTSDEVTALSKGVNPLKIRRASLVGYWPLWGLHSTEIDQSGGNVAMTVTGTTATTPPPVQPYTRNWQAFFDIAAAAAASIVASLDAAIQRQNVLATASLDAAIQRQNTAIASLDAALSAAQTATAQLDAALSAGKTAAASLDAAVQAPKTATASLDAAVEAAKSLSATLDAALQASRTATASLDAYLIGAAGSTITASLDAALQKAQTVAASLDAAIQRAGLTASASLDAALAKSQALVVLLDVAVARTNSADADLDAAVQIARTLSVGLDAKIGAFTISTKRTQIARAYDGVVVPRRGGRTNTVH